MDVRMHLYRSILFCTSRSVCGNRPETKICMCIFVCRQVSDTAIKVNCYIFALCYKKECSCLLVCFQARIAYCNDCFNRKIYHVFESLAFQTIWILSMVDKMQSTQTSCRSIEIKLTNYFEVIRLNMMTISRFNWYMNVIQFSISNLIGVIYFHKWFEWFSQLSV